MRHFSHFRPVALLKYALPLMLLMTSASAQAGDKTHHQQRTSGEAYVVHKDGAMVLDKTTNLVWQRCSVGQTFDNTKGCVGEVKNFNFNAAQQLSKDGWRVPTIRELQTLRVCSTGFNKEMKDLQDGGKQVARLCNNNANNNAIGPTINTTAFPNTESSHYWSSSPYVGDSNNAWDVVFHNGSVYHDFSRSDDFYVRLVRTSQSLGDAVALEFVTPLEKDTFAIAVKKAEEEYSKLNKQRTSGEAYVVHKDGAMVLDKTTNLVWQRCSVGQTFDNTKGCVGEAKRFTFEQAQQLSKNGWRVPTIRELQTLRVCSTGFNINHMEDLQDGGETVPSECNGNASQPTINTAAFPNTLDSNTYWSSSPCLGYLNNFWSSSLRCAWHVYFGSGYVRGKYYYRYNYYRYSSHSGSCVRLVRTSQSLGDAVALEFVSLQK